MLKKEDMIEIGRLTKVHGLKGELNFVFTNDVWDEVEADYLIVETDGLLVPFFLEEYRFKNDEEAFVKFKRIDNDRQACELTGCTVYIERRQLPANYLEKKAAEGDISIDLYIGYTIQADGATIGVIDDVDDSTANVLFSVTTPTGSNLIIPASDDYIVEINDEQKLMVMHLPEGLLDLD
ncbi:MAG: 16S rRNA processing protein RimM [Paludibacteraceae bacterium]|nr:16S rRNA processing protein RimM [Paludibacteraceae bacterium]